jgi:hypothetical protein
MSRTLLSMTASGKRALRADNRRLPSAELVVPDVTYGMHALAPFRVWEAQISDHAIDRIASKIEALCEHL